jgi:hypothetical protein
VLLSNLPYRKVHGYAVGLLKYLTPQERQQEKQKGHGICLMIEEIDQLGHILSNEYKHVKLDDATYRYNDGAKTSEMIKYILWVIKLEACRARDDVCRNCLMVHHPPVHSSGCGVCNRRWFQRCGIMYSPEEDYSGRTPSSFSYETPPTDTKKRKR